MAIGAPPRHTQEQELTDLPGEHFLALAIDAVQMLGWHLGYTSEAGFIAFTKASLNTLSEEIKVLIDNQTIRLASECTGTQLADWGKNKENIERLLEKVEELKTQLPPEAINHRYHSLKPSLIPSHKCVLSLPSATFTEKILRSVSSLFGR